MEGQCREGTSLGYNGECCFGAWFRSFNASYIHPIIFFFGVAISIASYQVLSTIVTTKRGSVTRRFFGPAHLLLRLAALNSLIFFISTLPLQVEKCFTAPFCNQRTGALGYALAVSIWIFPMFLNSLVHLCSYALTIFYGVERVFSMKHIRFFTPNKAVFCYAFGIQVRKQQLNFCFNFFI